LSEHDATFARERAERFTDRVADYERYRPGYPRALVARLREIGALPTPATVADIGSGTGISTALFLDAGCTVFAIEPNAAMRAAAEARLGGRAGFRSVDALAEATTLPDASVDLVAAGTAFHWFDRERTRAELARILRPGGCIALFWNTRSLDSAFMRELEAVLRAHIPEYAATNARERASEASLREFFGAGWIEHAVFPNPLRLDLDALLGRVASSSYSPRAGDPAREKLFADLRALFERRAESGRVTMLYDTHLHLGRLDT
jgi:SAM-dependent methyltransferase